MELPARPVSTTEGIVYHPWSNGWAIGFRAVHPDGRVEYVYLNPSGESDDGQPNVFLYAGTEGDPGQDPALVHVDVFDPDDTERHAGQAQLGVVVGWSERDDPIQPAAIRDHLGRVRVYDEARDRYGWAALFVDWSAREIR